MSKLAYDPSTYDADLRYLIGEHKSDIVSYMINRFPKNAHSIRVTMQNIVQGYIANMSNIYSAGVDYIGLDKKQYKRMLRRRAKAMKLMEQFFNYQNMSLLWTYLVNDEVHYMALDGSSFYIDYDDMGVMRSVIVRTGRFLDSSGDIRYHFKMWSNGKVFHCTGKDWGYISPEVSQGESSGLDSDLWSLDDVNDSYSVLPFTLIKSPYIVQPSHSTLIDLENEFVVSHGYMMMSVLIALIAKFAVISGGDGPMIQKMIKDIGVGTEVLHLGKQGDDVKMIQAISTDNHMNFTDIAQRTIMLRGQIDGVDKQALFPITKIQSGAALRMQNGSIVSKRNDRILDWEEFEDNNWVLVNKLTGGRVPVPEEVRFSDLPNQIDVVERVDIDVKNFQNLASKLSQGAITTEQFIRKSNPEADAATVKILVDALEGLKPSAFDAIQQEAE